jgi:nucleotide-binding universal stress UspA family protein
VRNTRTVVGWDGSEPADQALRWAADHEQWGGRTVHVVCVLTDPAHRSAADVSTARAALQGLVASLAETHPDLAVTAELAVGDPVHELARIADRTGLLVIGASRIDRIRRPRARRVPVAVVGRQEGVTAVIPFDAPPGRHGVVAVVRGRPGSAGTVAVAANAAVHLGEPLTLLRIRDPYEPADGSEPVTLERELRSLNHAFPDLPVQIDPGWVRGPIGLLSHSDRASLLVLEGHRPTSAPPRYSLERWLAGQARAPIVVVAEPLVQGQEARAAADRGRLVPAR